MHYKYQGLRKYLKLINRSRSSSQIQNVVLHRSDGRNNDCNNDGNTSAGTMHNKFIRKRIMHIKKSPDLFDCNDTDSSAFASNVSMVEIGSEMVTIKSDACSLNVGSAKNSDLKLEQSEIISGSKYEAELNKVLDCEMKAVIGKKKRKPNKTRKTSNDGVQNANQSLQNMSENPQKRTSYLDGAEHLPLLKRARVRMINSSSTGEEHNRIAQIEEKSIVVITSPLPIITSSDCENVCLADGDTSTLNRALASVSPKLLTSCSENGSQTSEVKKDQLFSFSMDDEFVLPPSKRIHRSLKAMSTNAAAAADGACIESPLSKMPSNGRCCISAATKRCSCMIIDNQGGDDLELKGLDSCGIDCSNNRVCSFSTCSNPMSLIEDKSSIEEDKQLTKSQKHESGKVIIPAPGARIQNGEDLSDSMVCAPDQTRIGSNNPTTGDTATFETELESSSSICYAE